jgi:hypothetical protein
VETAATSASGVMTAPRAIALRRSTLPFASSSGELPITAFARKKAPATAKSRIGVVELVFSQSG